MKERRISPRFTDEEYEQIEKVAAIRRCSLSELVRKATLEYIRPKVVEENMDFLCSIIRQELKNTQQPEADRLASLIAKTCIMAATSTFLCAETINRFVPTEKQMDVKEAYDAARIKGVNYMKGKDGKNESTRSF